MNVKFNNWGGRKCLLTTILWVLSFWFFWNITLADWHKTFLPIWINSEAMYDYMWSTISDYNCSWHISPTATLSSIPINRDWTLRTTAYTTLINDCQSRLKSGSHTEYLYQFLSPYILDEDVRKTNN